jgi:hypothetical protein
MFLPLVPAAAGLAGADREHGLANAKGDERMSVLPADEQTALRCELENLRLEITQLRHVLVHMAPVGPEMSSDTIIKDLQTQLMTLHRDLETQIRVLREDLARLQGSFDFHTVHPPKPKVREP